VRRSIERFSDNGRLQSKSRPRKSGKTIVSASDYAVFTLINARVHILSCGAKILKYYAKAKLALADVAERVIFPKFSLKMVFLE